jgi:hypothetical protein
MISGMGSNLPYYTLLAFRQFIRPFNEIIRAVSYAFRHWTAPILMVSNSTSSMQLIDCQFFQCS